MRIPHVTSKTILFVLVAFAAGTILSRFIFGLAFYRGTTFSSEGLSSSSLIGSLTPAQPADTAQSADILRLSLPSDWDVVGRMMIYTGHLSLEVTNIDLAIDSIYSISHSLGGNVTGISTSKEGGRKTAVVTVRVPQTSFNVAIDAIENLGEVQSKEVRGEDVTEQYVDLSARLRNLQNQEQRLTEILAMATTVEDVLKVESELNKARSEIEQITGQIKYLENRVELSTIIISLGEAKPLITIPEIDWGRSIEAGLWGVFVVVQGLIVIAIVAAPFAAIGVPLYYFVFRKRHAKTEAIT